jgi:hypothetical protein
MIKIIITSILAVLLIIFFTIQKTDQKSKLRVFNILETEIIGDSANILENDSSGFNIAYYEDFEVYEYPIMKLVADSDTPIMVNGNLTFMNRVSKDTVFNYYLAKTGGNKVFMYESIDSETHTTINRDSLLRKFNVDSLNLRSLNLELGSPYQTIRNKKTNSIEIEHYVDRKPLDESYADTISRYYDTKFKDIDFSYSPFLDKKNKSKLMLTRFIFLPRKVKQKNGKEEIIPYREDSSLIRETKTKRHDIYLALIKRFQKDSKIK